MEAGAQWYNIFKLFREKKLSTKNPILKIFQNFESCPSKMKTKIKMEIGKKLRVCHNIKY